jgi:hypothetical protein
MLPWGPTGGTSGAVSRRPGPANFPCTPANDGTGDSSVDDSSRGRVDGQREIRVLMNEVHA